MLKDFTTWLLQLIAKLFAAVWDFLSDVFIYVLEQVVNAFVTLITTIPMPGWLTAGLGGVFGQMDGGIIWLVSQCGVPQALAVIGGGYAFRMLRKIFTLFQW